MLDETPAERRWRLKELRRKIKILNRVIFAYLALAPLVVPVIRGPFARWYAATTGSDYDLICGMMWTCGFVSAFVTVGYRVVLGFELSNEEGRFQ